MARPNAVDSGAMPAINNRRQGAGEGLYREWLALMDRTLAQAGRLQSAAMASFRRRRSSIIIEAIRTEAQNLDDVVYKLALWRSVRESADAGPDWRTPSDALLKSVLRDLDAVRASS